MSGDTGRQEYRASWSRLHGGHEPTGVVRGWLDAVYPLARGLTRLRVTPNGVTLASLLLAVVAVPLSFVGGPLALLAAVFVALSAIADGVDGAVAVLSGRASRGGAILDSVTDRLGEAAFGVALWLAGAPGWLAAAVTGVAWLHEYVRARAAAVGVPGVGVITVGERPTRVIATAFGLAAAWPLGAAGPTIGAAAGGLLGLVGLVQLGLWLRRPDQGLRRPDQASCRSEQGLCRPDQAGDDGGRKGHEG